MPHLSSRQVFSPSCPSGGNWYACSSGSYFVGCCASDPCANSCPDGNLMPASFDPSYYGTFPDQQCPTGSRWYTCTGTDPPFLGCCKSSPCGNGCPDGDLTAGFLDSNPAVAAPFLSTGSTSTGSPPTTTTTLTTSLATSSQYASSATRSTASATSSTAVPVLAAPTVHHTGIIAGAAVGGVVAIAVVLLLFWYHKRHVAMSRRQSQQRMTSFETDKTTQGTAMDVRDMKGAFPPENPSQKPLLNMVEAPDSPSLMDRAPLSGNKVGYSGKDAPPMHSLQDSYELPSPYIGHSRSQSLSPPPLYAYNLNSSPAMPNSPSSLSLTPESVSRPFTQDMSYELPSTESQRYPPVLLGDLSDGRSHATKPTPATPPPRAPEHFTHIRDPSFNRQYQP